jgi:hypothetical protein
MSSKALFSEAVDFAVQVDFTRSKTASTVSVFETTIRYVGGLFSAFELGDKNELRLIDQAQVLLNKMTVAWRNNVSQSIESSWMDLTLSLARHTEPIHAVRFREFHLQSSYGRNGMKFYSRPSQSLKYPLM